MAALHRQVKGRNMWISSIEKTWSAKKTLSADCRGGQTSASMVDRIAQALGAASSRPARADLFDGGSTQNAARGPERTRGNVRELEGRSACLSRRRANRLRRGSARTRCKNCELSHVAPQHRSHRERFAKPRAAFARDNALVRSSQPTRESNGLEADDSRIRAWSDTHEKTNAYFERSCFVVARLRTRCSPRSSASDHGCLANVRAESFAHDFGPTAACVSSCASAVCGFHPPPSAFMRNTVDAKRWFRICASLSSFVSSVRSASITCR